MGFCNVNLAIRFLMGFWITLSGVGGYCRGFEKGRAPWATETLLPPPSLRLEKISESPPIDLLSNTLKFTLDNKLLTLRRTCVQHIFQGNISRFSLYIQEKTIHYKKVKDIDCILKLVSTFLLLF